MPSACSWMPRKLAQQKATKNRQEAESSKETQTASARLPSLGTPHEMMRRSNSGQHRRRSWYGPTAATLRCLNAVKQMTDSDEGKRNMKNLDGKFMDDMGSRDVIQWSSSLMQEFKVHFTPKVIFVCLISPLDWILTAPRTYACTRGYFSKTRMTPLLTEGNARKALQRVRMSTNSP